MNIDNLTLTQLFNYKSKKDENGHINSAREQKLFEELNLKNKTQDNISKTILSKLKEYGLDFEKCKKIGGCGNSHDFEFYCKDKIYNVELKVSNSGKLPQLADIYIKDVKNEFIKNQFISFTDGWFDVLKNIKKEFKLIQDLNKEEFIKYICSIPKKNNPNCLFLEELKKIIRKKNNNDIKNKLENYSKEYISKFLFDNLKNVKKENILEIYKKKLDCKDFIIKYTQNSKKIELIKNEPLQLEIESISLKKSKDQQINIGYDIKFKITEDEEIRYENTIIRLRYKNGTGLYGVCWQLGVLRL
jgi:hypothetical protein